jgi:hypothetical protein
MKNSNNIIRKSLYGIGVVCIIGMLLALLGCSNSLLGPGDDIDDGLHVDPPTVVTIPEEYPTHYRYLGYMYSPVSGKSIHDEVFSGPVMAEYSNEIRGYLNAALNFPLNEVNTRVNWYESMPAEITDSIEDYAIEFGSDLLAEAIDKGFWNYLESPEGQDLVNGYMEDAFDLGKDLTDYAVDRLADEFQSEINLALAEGGIIAGTSVISLLQSAGTFATSPWLATGVSAGLSYYQNTQIMGKLDDIKNMLEDIQEKLDEIEYKVDMVASSVQDLTVFEKYKDAQDAAAELTAIYKTLNYLRNSDPDKYRDYIETKMIDQFQTLLEKTVTAIELTQDHIISNNMEGKIVYDDLYIKRYKKTRRRMRAGYTTDVDKLSTITLSEETPFHYCHYYLKNINLLKRLSLMRLSLLAEIYQGEELVSLRNSIAVDELESLLLPIKAKIDAGWNDFNASLDSDTDYSGLLGAKRSKNSSGSEYVGTYYVAELYHNGKKVHTTSELKKTTTTKWEGSGKFRKKVTVVKYSFDHSSTHALNDKAAGFLRGKTMAENSEHRNYFITSMAALCDWEVQLRSHIAAGGDA